SNIQTGLDAIYGSNNSLARLGTITSGIGTIIVQFIGANATVAMRLMTANYSSMTGTTPSVTVASTKSGGVVVSTAPPITYVNTSSTAVNPTWQPRGILPLLSLGSPALGSGITVHAGVADTGSQQTISTAITNPDVPRCLVFTPSGTTANVTAVQMIVTGTDANDNVLTETLPAFTAGAATAVTSVNAFKAVTSYIQPACGASVTITPTCSPKLGLGIPMTNDGILTGFLNGVRESTRPTGTASTIMSKSLVQLSSALNGTAVLIQVTPN
ncbi:hypothetical protein KGP36_07745, partial [Patescibacteria group bacterium]|nr:hypothetical protein [Patescibacteria group bacterium]